MNVINVNIMNCLEINRIKSRPNASSGFWISILLPLAVIIPLFKNPNILTIVYKLETFIALGLIISNLILIYCFIKYRDFNIRTVHYVSIILISILFYAGLRKGILFSFYSGIFSTYLYYLTFPFVLKVLPFSFTFGEATLITQSFILFTYGTIFNVFNTISNVPVYSLQISTLILQIGITGIGAIAFLTYTFKFFRNPIHFYVLTLGIILFWILIPLQILLERNALLWIFQLLTNNIRVLSVILFWIVCTIFAIVVVNKQIRKGRKANTVVRKAFHILAVVVYLVGFIDQCNLLYLASGIVFAIFITLEMLRILNIPPLGIHLQDGFAVFSDEKDSGPVAFTPLYLLAGCSLPLWLHPDGCDVTDSVGFNLLPLMSGLLSIGIGDTFASAIGCCIGKHKWPGSDKTIEGTVACLFGQFALVYLLFYSGYIIYNSVNVTKAILSIIIVSIIEAKTDQVDNLILPLIMYIIMF